MKIIVVDDEPKALSSFLRVLQEVEPEADIVTFTDSQDAFVYLAKHTVDIAFLDIKMGELSGIELTEKCKSLCQRVNIIFVTGYSRYTMDALRLHVSGYLLKPVRAEELRAEINNLRYPLLPSASRVRIHTFGNFEIFVDNKPLKVPRTKCKECLAYLVDRKGAGVPFAQLSAVLWEDRPNGRSTQKSTHKIVSDLVKALKKEKADEILIRSHTEISIDITKVDCDFFSAARGDKEWMNVFHNEYMNQYSWAEFTLGELVDIKERNIRS